MRKQVMAVEKMMCAGPVYTVQIKWFRTSQDDVQIDNSLWSKEGKRKRVFDAFICFDRILGHTHSDITHVLCGCNILQWFQKAYRFSSLINSCFLVWIQICACAINAVAQASNTRSNHIASYTHARTSFRSHWTFQNRNKWVILTMILSTTAHPTWPICCSCYQFSMLGWMGGFCYAMHGHKSMGNSKLMECSQCNPLNKISANALHICIKYGYSYI